MVFHIATILLPFSRWKDQASKQMSTPEESKEWGKVGRE